MIIFLGHLHVAYNQIDTPSICRHSLSLLQCFDTFDVTELKPYMITTHFSIKTYTIIPYVLWISFYLTNDAIFAHVYTFFYHYCFTIIVDHLKPYH